METKNSLTKHALTWGGVMAAYSLLIPVIRIYAFNNLLGGGFGWIMFFINILVVGFAVNLWKKSMDEPATLGKLFSLAILIFIFFRGFIALGNWLIFSVIDPGTGTRITDFILANFSEVYESMGYDDAMIDMVSQVIQSYFSLWFQLAISALSLILDLLKSLVIGAILKSRKSDFD